MMKLSRKSQKKFPNALPKIIVVLGPTSSGKSDLAVDIAKFVVKNKRKFGTSGAEIISADSRQVYKGFDLVSGKVPILYKQAKRLSTKLSIPPLSRKGGIEMYYRNIKHYLLDVASPKKTFSVARYQKLGREVIYQLLKENKTPIICGGTGLYIDSLIYDVNFPTVKPNPKLRKQLERMEAGKLFERLSRLDPERAASIDRFNKRRLIRALEIVTATGKPVPRLDKISRYDTFSIGINLPRQELKERIYKRILERLRRGMIKEIWNLNKKGISWKRLEDFGLEFKWLSFFLQKKISKQEMIDGLYRETCAYAKRQMTWFGKNKEIKWIKNKQKALKLVEDFLAVAN